MHRLSTIFALLLLVCTTAPVLACVTEQAMTREQSACCRAMHGDCGGMAKMGCCHTKMATDDQPQIKASVQPVQIHWTLVAFLLPFVEVHWSPAPMLSKIPDEHSPPGLLIVRTTNLRI